MSDAFNAVEGSLRNLLQQLSAQALSEEEVDQQVRKMRTKIHPDRFAACGADVQDRATAAFQELEAKYREHKRVNGAECDGSEEEEDDMAFDPTSFDVLPDTGAARPSDQFIAQVSRFGLMVREGGWSTLLTIASETNTYLSQEAAKARDKQPRLTLLPCRLPHCSFAAASMAQLREHAKQDHKCYELFLPALWDQVASKHPFDLLDVDMEEAEVLFDLALVVFRKSKTDTRFNTAINDSEPRTLAGCEVVQTYVAGQHLPTLAWPEGVVAALAKKGVTGDLLPTCEPLAVLQATGTAQCATCAATFTMLRWRQACSACQSAVCSACLSNMALCPKPDNTMTQGRLCQTCKGVASMQALSAWLSMARNCAASTQATIQDFQLATGMMEYYKGAAMAAASESELEEMQMDVKEVALALAGSETASGAEQAFGSAATIARLLQLLSNPLRHWLDVLQLMVEAYESKLVLTVAMHAAALFPPLDQNTSNTPRQVIQVFFDERCSQSTASTSGALALQLLILAYCAQQKHRVAAEAVQLGLNKLDPRFEYFDMVMQAAAMAFSEETVSSDRASKNMAAVLSESARYSSTACTHAYMLMHVLNDKETPAVLAAALYPVVFEAGDYSLAAQLLVVRLHAANVDPLHLDSPKAKEYSRLIERLAVCYSKLGHHRVAAELSAQPTPAMLAAAKHEVEDVTQLLVAFGEGDLERACNHLDLVLYGLGNVDAVTTLIAAVDASVEDRSGMQRAIILLARAVFVVVKTSMTPEQVQYAVEQVLTAVAEVPVSDVANLAGTILGTPALHKVATEKAFANPNLLGLPACLSNSTLDRIDKLNKLFDAVPRSLRRAEAHYMKEAKLSEQDPTAHHQALLSLAKTYMDMTPFLSGGLATVAAFMKAMDAFVAAAAVAPNPGSSAALVACAFLNGADAIDVLLSIPSAGAIASAWYTELLQRGCRALQAASDRIEQLTDGRGRRTAPFVAPSDDAQSEAKALKWIICVKANHVVARRIASLESFPYYPRVDSWHNTNLGSLTLLLQSSLAAGASQLQTLQSASLELNMMKDTVYPRLAVVALPLFEGLFNGWAESDDEAKKPAVEQSWQQQRYIAMLGRLHGSNLPVRHVISNALSGSVARDPEGWIIKGGMTLPGKGFHSAKSLTLTSSGDILVETGRLSAFWSNLVCYQDIADLAQMGAPPAVAFTLDSNPSLPSDPFHAMHYTPASLKDTGYLEALVQTDWILKMLVSGVEICAVPPFPLKPADQGLYRLLPTRLVQKLSRIQSLPRQHSAHRFWIENEAMSFNMHGDVGRVTAVVDANVKMVIKCRRLMLDDEGDYVDLPPSDADGRDTDPMVAMATLLTDHYRDLEAAFPVFARLRELSRLMFMMRLLCAQASDEGSLSARTGYRTQLQEWSSVLRQGGFPASSRSRDSIKAELLRINNIGPGDRVDQASLNSAINKAMSDAQAADAQVVSSIAKALAQMTAIDLSNANGLAHDFAYRRVSIDTTLGQVMELRQQTRGQLTSKYGFSWNLGDPKPLRQASTVALLPASFRKDSKHKAIGGVALSCNGSHSAGLKGSSGGGGVPPTKSHSGSWSRVKAQVKESLASDPKAPAHVRGWLNNQYRQRRSWYKVRNPPGCDIDHTRNAPEYCRLALSTMNRGRSPHYERVRTRSQPPVSGGHY
eukprot:m.180892 g.180892  ORF g.180892 m.180892 type:complete len:1668 (+) comp16865_c0_seq1:118-5121(+)